MANLLFKKGSYNDFKTKVLGGKAVAGTLYLTEDEGSLYLGKSDGSVTRIQGTVHQYATLKDFGASVTPPYSTDVVYFIADKNALVRWDGSNWIQLNTSKATFDAKVGELNTAIGGVASDLGEAVARIGANEGAIKTLNTEVTKKADKTTVNGIDGRLQTVEGTVATHVQTIKTLATKSEVQAVASDLGEVSTKVTNLESNKVDKVSGKGLSTNDFTNAYKEKLDNIAPKATETYVDSTLNTNADDNHAISNATATVKFNEIDEDIRELNTDIEAVEKDLVDNYVTKVTYNEQIGDITGDIKAIEDALGLGETAGDNTVGKRLDALETLTSGHTTTISGHTSDIAELQTATGTNAGNITTLQGQMTTVTQKANDNATAITTLRNDVADTYVTKTTYNGKVAEIEGNVSGNAADIKELQDEIKTKATKTELNNLDTALQAKIDSEIKAVNAMTYKGGISTQAALNALTGVKVGDTYVVSSAFGSYQPGDLLVASGTETNGVLTSITWNHVETGYNADHQPTLSVSNNVISLTSVTQDDLGSINIVSATENLTVSTVGTNTISINMEWGSF